MTNKERILALAIIANSIDKKTLMSITGLTAVEINEGMAQLSNENKLAMYAFENGQFTLTKDPEKCVQIIASPLYTLDDVFN